jgi:hypothetical protein
MPDANQNILSVRLAKYPEPDLSLVDIMHHQGMIRTRALHAGCPDHVQQVQGIPATLGRMQTRTKTYIYRGLLDNNNNIAPALDIVLFTTHFSLFRMSAHGSTRDARRPALV